MKITDQQTGLKFDTSLSDMQLIHAITSHAMVLAAQQGMDLDPLALSMDLTACHANGCPLRLADLLGASAGDFVHDVWGIQKHLNRKTGGLHDFFVPRFAATGVAA